ncbi:CD3324 family protein [Brevibacillus ruminantium]|uniref:CD3324 family protein n=1 Tax=Brevibacillus ruminantium TaxID=2950604 RepID=A0ABY4WD05_9BACL|nr:CD3324 family protein [Brevibacillus ruminantium]USG65040.1 CD3324 family protein [Brevibacillus ruminantium]
MRYVKATTILPEQLIKEIQKYIQGETLYIPKQKTTYQKWGARSGGRKLIDERNAQIKNAFQNGTTIQQLAEDYFLAVETIKRIVYSHK